jgi:hypothetical protein
VWGLGEQTTDACKQTSLQAMAFLTVLRSCHAQETRVKGTSSRTCSTWTG